MRLQFSWFRSVLLSSTIGIWPSAYSVLKSFSIVSHRKLIARMELIGQKRLPNKYILWRQTEDSPMQAFFSLPSWITQLVVRTGFTLHWLLVSPQVRTKVMRHFCASTPPERNESTLQHVWCSPERINPISKLPEARVKEPCKPWEQERNNWIQHWE